MSHQRRPQCGEHFELRVEVVAEDILVGTSGDLAGLVIHRRVEVDGHGVYMVHATYEEVHRILLQDVLDDTQRARPDPLAFKADQDLDLICVRLLQTSSFVVVVIEQLREACLRVNFLLFRVEVDFLSRDMFRQAER